MTRVPSLALFFAALGRAPAPAPVPAVAASPPAQPSALPAPANQYEGYAVSLNLRSAQAFELLAAMDRLRRPRRAAQIVRQHG